MTWGFGRLHTDGDGVPLRLSDLTGDYCRRCGQDETYGTMSPIRGVCYPCYAWPTRLWWFCIGGRRKQL